LADKSCLLLALSLFQRATAAAVIELVRAFDDFTEDNDPYGEQDFGSFAFKGQLINWKIDYYALDMAHGSEDPANAAITKRVLTILLAEEY
jgi:Protein of unknown function (DUF3768)